MKPVLVIGNTTCDIVLQIDNLPKAQEDALVQSQTLALGGCAFNVVNMLSLFDIPYVFLSNVGEGMYGDFIRKQLQERQIKYVRNDAGEHGCCYCFVEKDKDRTFLAYHGVEYTFKREWIESYKNIEFAYIYIAGLDVEAKDGEEIIAALKELNGEIVFAPGSRCEYLSQEKLKELYALHPILHMNEKESLFLGQGDTYQEAAKKLYAITKNKVIITLGEDGVYCYDEKELYVPSVSTSVTNTLGAGDAHIAAFMIAKTNGKEEIDALQFANEVAAHVVKEETSTLLYKPENLDI